MSKKEETIKLQGIITDVLPGANFKVKLDNGHKISAYLCGKMRRYFIRIIPGDKVDVEMSPYSLNMGRITFRYKG